MYYYNGGSMKKIFALCIFFFCFSVNVSNKFSVKLDKCIDGDTARFFINGESKTVRFLAINAPEIQHDDVLEEFYGKESSEYVCKVLNRSSKIKLQYDPKSEKVDKYDRVLAWVFVDDKLLQSELVSKGYAEVKYLYDDYLYSNDLKDLEIKAKEKKLGMWSNRSTSKNNNDFPSLKDIIIYIAAILVVGIISLFRKVFK